LTVVKYGRSTVEDALHCDFAQHPSTQMYLAAKEIWNIVGA
jgi:hypothetical protein